MFGFTPCIWTAVMSGQVGLRWYRRDSMYSYIREVLVHHLDL